jgi:hypothetical protein
MKHAFVMGLGFDPKALVASLKQRGMVSFAKPVRTQSYSGRRIRSYREKCANPCVGEADRSQRMADAAKAKAPCLIGFSQAERQLITRILDAVCAEWHVTPNHLASHCRLDELLWPRFVAIHLLTIAGFKPMKVAGIFYRDRSLVVNVIDRIALERKQDEKSDQIIARLEAQLNLNQEVAA